MSLNSRECDPQCARKGCLGSVTGNIKKANYDCSVFPSCWVAPSPASLSLWLVACWMCFDVERHRFCSVGVAATVGLTPLHPAQLWSRQWRNKVRARSCRLALRCCSTACVLCDHAPRDSQSKFSSVPAANCLTALLHTLDNLRTWWRRM